MVGIAQSSAGFQQIAPKVLLIPIHGSARQARTGRRTGRAARVAQEPSGADRRGLADLPR